MKNLNTNLSTNKELQCKLKEIHQFCQCETYCNCEPCCRMFENMYPELKGYLEDVEDKCCVRYPSENSTIVQMPEFDFYPSLTIHNTSVKPAAGLYTGTTDGINIELPLLFDYIKMPDGFLIRFSLIVDIDYSDHDCTANEYDFYVAIYAAPPGSRVFRLVPESKIIFEKLIVPPYTAVHYSKELGGFNAPIFKDHNYVFAAYYTHKNSENFSKCKIRGLVKGEYEYYVN